MAEPTEPFDVLDKLAVPGLWPEIREREPRRPSPREGRTLHRAVVVATVLALAAAAVVFAALAFRPSLAPPVGPPPSSSNPPPTSRSPGSVTNGEIWARVGGGDGASYLYSVQPDGSDETMLWNDGRDPNVAPGTIRPELVGEGYAWSPDGSRVAFEHYVHQGKYLADEIFTMNADGSDLRQVTHDSGRDSHPSWSPHGTRIVYAYTAAPRFAPAGCEGTALCPSDIYVINVDGSGKQQLTNDTADDSQPSWSPDGTEIAFVSGRNDAHGDIYVMNADGAGVTDLTPGSHWDSHPGWSPDGTKIAFVRGAFQEAFGLYVMNPDGAGVQMLADQVGEFAWSPDGTMIAFARPGGDGLDDLWMMPADGSEKVLLTGFNGAGVGVLAWRPLPAG